MLGGGKKFPTCYTLYWHVFQRKSQPIFIRRIAPDRVNLASKRGKNSEKACHRGQSLGGDSGRLFLGQNWNEAIIITKERANISWEQIQVVLGNSVQRRVDLFPFLANKAAWWPANKSEYSYFLKLKRGFFENRVTLVFDHWVPEIN